MKRRVVIIGISACVVIIITTAAAVSWLLQDKLIAQNSVERPAFAFDSAAMPGWYTGGNNWPNPDDLEGGVMRKNELPKADISIHQGVNEQDVIHGHCFTMAAFYDKAIDINEQLQKNVISSTGDDGRIITPVGTSDVAIMTYDGLKTLSLHKYDISGPAAKDLQRGMANGYVALSNGHLAIQSVCQESSQLDETVPVHSATSLVIRTNEK